MEKPELKVGWALAPEGAKVLGHIIVREGKVVWRAPVWGRQRIAVGAYEGHREVVTKNGAYLLVATGQVMTGEDRARFAEHEGTALDALLESAADEGRL